MAGNYPCCCGRGGGIVQPCTNCTKLTVTITGVADTHAPGFFTVACGFANFNTTAVLTLNSSTCEDTVNIHHMTNGLNPYRATSACTCTVQSGANTAYMALRGFVYQSGCSGSNDWKTEIRLQWQELGNFNIPKLAYVSFVSSCNTAGASCSDSTWTMNSSNFSSSVSDYFTCLPIDYSSIGITVTAGT